MAPTSWANALSIGSRPVCTATRHARISRLLPARVECRETVRSLALCASPTTPIYGTFSSNQSHRSRLSSLLEKQVLTRSLLSSPTRLSLPTQSLGLRNFSSPEAAMPTLPTLLSATGALVWSRRWSEARPPFLGSALPPPPIPCLLFVLCEYVKDLCMLNVFL